MVKKPVLTNDAAFSSEAAITQHLFESVLATKGEFKQYQYSSSSTLHKSTRNFRHSLLVPQSRVCFFTTK
jgi:hypothetical protein